MSLQWCIFYDDGSQFTNEDGRPEDAPVDGVQVIIEYDTDGRGGRHIHQGHDLYWYMGEGCWASGARVDFEKHERRRPPIAWVVLYGRWMARNEYQALVDTAVRGECHGC